MRNGAKGNRTFACGAAHGWKIYGQLLLGVVLAVLMGAATAAADVKLPAVIGDNMVLQQGRQVAIWGTADAGEQVTVSLGEQKETATADSDGKWKVELGPLKQGGPFEMTVAGKNTVTVHNVLVGEVWVCSGQSNMEFTVWNPLCRGRQER